jgi:hypothetical protein
MFILPRLSFCDLGPGELHYRTSTLSRIEPAGKLQVGHPLGLWKLLLKVNSRGPGGDKKLYRTPLRAVPQVAVIRKM